MEYHVFKQVIQTVLIAILIPFGAMVILEIIPTVIGNKTARQAAKKIQELKERNADLMTEVEDAKESKQKIGKLMEEREADKHEIAGLTKKLEAAEEKSQLLTDALYVEAEDAEKSQLEIVDLTDELDAARNFAATTLNTAFQTNQEAREKTVDMLKDLSERIAMFQKIAEISNNSMKQHLEQVRKFCHFGNVGLQNWTGEIKVIQECIRLDYGRIKLLDEATAMGHNLQATMDEIDEAAKKQSPYFNAPSPSCSA
ncbi:uncharacterized protein CLUP02_13435 [Colletotrichum lupini]|uniref:Uncharacterized protein n=1 Tax=Colletotrichum lupini TaxID=145971 RepID=A0A9Q8T262_9PEZI|nr:uncharacterized protein CLUP02_13435 [Colletotrichum lupini]KAK1701821.1 hypothetical protein BDP67DRAFT_585834 [Colletotrichum lupini]UQC87914.1 hypothetical protein CLUP02_13435 [Colletotrichum lupini]